MPDLLRNTVVSAIAAAALVGSVSWALRETVVPSMVRDGNEPLLQRATLAFENFYANHGAWPRGNQREVWNQLIGRHRRFTLDADGSLKAEAVLDPLTQKELTGEEEDETSQTEEFSIPTANHTTGFERMSSFVLSDAWGQPVEIEYPEDGTLRLVSVGEDGVRGTADDATATAHPKPRAMLPDRRDYERVRQRQLRMAAEAAEKARRAAEKAKRAAR